LSILVQGNGTKEDDQSINTHDGFVGIVKLIHISIFLIFNYLFHLNICVLIERRFQPLPQKHTDVVRNVYFLRNLTFFYQPNWLYNILTFFFNELSQTACLRFIFFIFLRILCFNYLFLNLTLYWLSLHRRNSSFFSLRLTNTIYMFLSFSFSSFPCFLIFGLNVLKTAIKQENS
jgi:hypothetical protein